MMSTFFDRLKSIALPTKDLINGYVRRCQKELFDDIAIDNPYYYIPQLINDHCMLFYEVWRWYRKNYGQGIKFLSDTEVTVENDDGWMTCMFENAISNDFCHLFSITFKLKSFGTDLSAPDFYIGYTTGPSLETSILNWTHIIGEDHNASSSCAWDVYDDELFFSGEGKNFDQVGYYSKYHVNDLFKLVIDFGANSVSIYHNDFEADSRKINAKKLWVGFSLGYCHNRIEMVGYEYK